ncbi:hypothetical protein [Rubripirellula amarantea]|nr:hypothetical protein [Rubripirellula amarantea]
MADAFRIQQDGRELSRLCCHTMMEMNKIVAELGGYTSRENTSPPGHQ